MSVYSWLFRSVIHRTDPERAHHAGLNAVAWAGRHGLIRALMRATIGYWDPHARSMLLWPTRSLPTIGERTVHGRLGLAAGMDKDARAIEGMCALGFGFVEIGTITPRPQPGNDRPRLWRLMDQAGLRNRMGFNNEGVDQAVAQLRELRSTRHGRRCIVGANIGKNKVTPPDQAPRDYEICAQKVAPWVDFIVVNVSSPNTPGLRDLQAVDQLRPILEAARRGADAAQQRRHVPLLVKIAPDLSDDDIIEVCSMSRDMKLDGIVATNTTINHEWGEGGVSGAPLFPRALDVVSLVAEHLDDHQLLIGTGGIFTASQAQAMLDAGADLVEAFSAFVFEGPTWPGAMNRALALN